MPSIPRAVCIDCGVRMRPKENGAHIEFQMGNRDDPKPYFKVMGDIWECPECDAAIAIGFGANPLAEHYEGEKYDAVKTDYIVQP